MRCCLFFWLLASCSGSLAAQAPAWSYPWRTGKAIEDYYVPNTNFDPAIPSPYQYLRYDVGSRHVTHDEIIGYMRALDQSSPRIEISEYGYSHEGRPLMVLMVSSPANLANKTAIQAARRDLANPTKNLPSTNMPAVAYMGYSIHGNEASGSNAALVVAYWLAAAQGPQIDSLLQNTFILLDPCFNPDGVQRFANWVNSHKSASQRTDPGDDEYNEHWPGGRTNHYWFDLNRDWLVMQQPESKGRVQLLQDWKPNVLTDHHEMGTNSTFFFQPGVATRVHPITPARNQQLTAAIALRHADALSKLGILFYTGENYDDFYYGKGSTYPDANGAVGILFEQGSSRGAAQESDNGILSFPYSIRNQVITSFSTLKAVGELRTDLNAYLREFYQSAIAEAKKDPEQGYIFGDENFAPEVTHAFREILRTHQIQLGLIQQKVIVNGQTFEPQKAWFVPSDQPQYRLVKAIFERRTNFQDSIFYDISAWTLPDAFGLPWAAVSRKQSVEWSVTPAAMQAPNTSVAEAEPILDSTVYAFLVQPYSHHIYELLRDLHRRNVRVKVATKAFKTDNASFVEGTLLISFDRQQSDRKSVYKLLKNHDCAFSIVQNGLTPDGPDLGSSNFLLCRQPRVLVVTGAGVSPTDVGEVWHVLDKKLGLAPTLTEASRVSSLTLNKYTTIVLSDGTFPLLPVEKLKEFVNNGGTIIGLGAALRWLKANELAPLEFKISEESFGKQRRPYGLRAEDQSARNLQGAIFEAELDLSHPLCYGYRRDRMAVFLADTLFVEPNAGMYNNPAVMAAQPLLAGYLHRSQAKAVSGAAATAVYPNGRGRVICFPINPLFRGFWWGSERLFNNAVFYGHLIR